MFELDKWYADAISPEGDVFIGYCARVRAGALAFSYECALERRGQVEARTAHSLRRSSPEAQIGEVAWKSAGLRISGRWTGSGAGIRETVYESGEGSIDWHVMQPNARAEVWTRSGPLRGLGYAERLRMTIAPWRLPIRTLRWGRFLTPEETLVWIGWSGDFSTSIVCRNGARREAVHIGDDALVLEGGVTLAFDRGAILRRGAIGSTVLRRIPGIDKVAPARLFAVDECKWLSRATLERPGEPPVTGWSIHEVVEWP